MGSCIHDEYSPGLNYSALTLLVCQDKEPDPEKIKLLREQQVLHPRPPNPKLISQNVCIDKFEKVNSPQNRQLFVYCY